MPTVVPISELVLLPQVTAELKSNGLTLTPFIFLRLVAEQVEEGIASFIERAHRDNRTVVGITFSSMPVGFKRMLDIGVEICLKCKPPNGRHPACIVLAGGQKGDEGHPERERLEADGRLLVLKRPVPFGALFPLIDAAILHGGLGVTSEALMAGIPVITSGILLMDQRYWAARMHQLGCGSEGLPVDELLRPARLGDTKSLIVEVMEQALAGDPNGSEGWRARARKLKKQLLDYTGDDIDGIRGNAEAVYEAVGLARREEDGRAPARPIIRKGYQRRNSCIWVCLRQFDCIASCLAGAARWLLCMQVPACFLFWYRMIHCCICCKPFRRCCLAMARRSQRTARSELDSFVDEGASPV